MDHQRCTVRCGVVGGRCLSDGCCGESVGVCGPWQCQDGWGWEVGVPTLLVCPLLVSQCSISCTRPADRSCMLPQLLGAPLVQRNPVWSECVGLESENLLFHSHISVQHPLKTICSASGLCRMDSRPYSSTPPRNHQSYPPQCILQTLMSSGWPPRSYEHSVQQPF
jgi:hypothetical protein